MGLLSSSHPTIQDAETAVAVGLEWAHAEFVGEGEGLLVGGFGRRALRRITLRGNLAKKA